MKQVAIVILNWNGEELLKKFLPILIANTNGEVADLIVVDNGSSDGSVEYLQSVPQIKTLRFEENLGFAAGYNRAIAELEYSYIMILNSDVAVGDGWLDSLLSFITNHPEVVAVQPTIRSERHPKNFEYAGAGGGYMDFLGYPFCRGRIFDTIEEDQKQYGDEPKQVFWTTGAAMLVRRDAFLKSGGFDERFFAHQEEIDLCWRWNCEGHQLFVVPKSVVYHVGGASLSTQNPRKTFFNFRNNLWMLHKLLPSGQLPWTMLVRYFLDRLAAIVFLLQGKPKDAKAIIKAWWSFWSAPGKRDRSIHRKEGFRRLYHRMILWEYHMRGRKKYSELK